jgi:hypothetical protein
LVANTRYGIKRNVVNWRFLQLAGGGGGGENARTEIADAGEQNSRSCFARISLFWHVSSVMKQVFS